MQYNQRPHSSYDLSSLGVYDPQAHYQQGVGSWYNPRTWFKKNKKSKPLFWDTGLNIAESVVKSDLAKNTAKATGNKILDSKMQVKTTTTYTKNGKSSTKTSNSKTTMRDQMNKFTDFFSGYPEMQNLSSLGVYDPNTVAMSGLFDTIKSVGKGVASTVTGAAKGVVNTVTGSAKKKAKSSVKAATDAAAKKASATIKSKTGVDVSAKDLTSAAKDISKGNISKGVTNLGTKVASQAVNKYGAQAATQLSQLTNQYTSALNVPQSSTNIGSQTSALTAQSSIPMQQTASSSSAVANQASAVDKEEQGLSTGAMVGIGVGVLGLLGVGGYFLWSAKENKKQSRIEQQQRAAQYENLQAINNPKPKKSKAKTKSKSKAKTRK